MYKDTLTINKKQLVYPDHIAEVKLSYQKTKTNIVLPKVTSSSDVANLLFKNWDPETIEYFETFKILLLDRNNRVLGLYKISEGGTSGCVVDVKKIFQAALVTSSSSIILAHNHPSGNPNPSEADKRITQKIKQVGLEMDLPVLDHLIILPQGNYTSFSDEGIL
jgi:DNA repair protein RadC